MADASEEFRRLLVETLRGEGDLSVVGETGDGEAAVELCRQRQCDVLVMDMILASLDGVEVLSKVSAMTPKPKVLVISSFASGSVADLAGADYFMMKPCRTSAVVERVRQMVTGARPAEEDTRGQGLESTVTAIIHEIGVPAHIKGYQYLREAIMITVEDMDVINAVTKVLYPEVGPGRSGDTSEVFRVHSFQRQGKAYQFGVHRHDRRPAAAAEKAAVRRVRTYFPAWDGCREQTSCRRTCERQNRKDTADCGVLFCFSQFISVFPGKKWRCQIEFPKSK